MAVKAQNNDRRTLSEINITPLVDVMLVLLVIFMITAPLIQHGVKVDLPKAEVPTIESKENELIVSIDKNKKIYILDQMYDFKEFKEKIKFIGREKSRKKIFLTADRSLPYGIVVRTMSVIKNAGFEELGLVTEPIID